jgi:hypothetical protein
MNNIYSPPAANLNSNGALTARKPRSIWVLQLVLAIFLVPFFIGIASSISMVVAGGTPSGVVLAFMLGRVACALLLAAALAVVSLQYRHARLVAIVCVAMFAVVVLFAALKTPLPVETGSAYLVGHCLGLLLCMLPVVYWLYAVAFSQKAVDFYAAAELRRLQRRAAKAPGLAA